MISIEQINGEIAALEEQIPTHVIMQRLASLYTVRDHMGIVKQDNPPVNISADVGNYGDTEFLTNIAGKDPKKMWLIINDLMNALQVLNSRLYNNVISQIKDSI